MNFASIVGKVSALTDLLGSSAPIALGHVEFDSWDVPEILSWGGAQQLVVHRLPGGDRVIDAMGRDDRPIEWAGVFLGPDAERRALDLDEMRTSGQPQPLTWGSMYFTVVVRECTYEVRSGAVGYRVTCEVLRDEGGTESGEESILGGILADINEAVGFDVVAEAQTALGYAQKAAQAVTVLSGGSPAVVNVLGGVTAAQGYLTMGLTTAGKALDGLSAAAGQVGNLLGTSNPITGVAALNDAAAASGQAAQSSAALAHTGRAATQLQGAMP